MKSLRAILGVGSRYLRAADVPDGYEQQLTIDRVETETLQNADSDNEEEKAVLYFHGKDKGLVLNKSNGEILIAAYGDDPDVMRGKPVVLFRTVASLRGSTVPALRLRVPATCEEEAPF
jgi:hypothetical protein